jgi:hypothetical protein
MPREARIDAPGALHSIIIRGIKCWAIFKNAADRSDFLKRPDRILPETKTSCYAWVLMNKSSCRPRSRCIDKLLKCKYVTDVPFIPPFIPPV